jgi:mono/diheme cytochrome c family protein
MIQNFMKYILTISLLTFFISSALIQQKPKVARSGTSRIIKTKKQAIGNQSLADSGKIIYETYCLACHQEDGNGVPGMNPPLSKTDWVLGDSTRLINVILKGLKDAEVNGETYSNEMPSHDFLTDKQIAEVLTFVRKSFGNNASAISVEDVKKQRGK